MQPKTEINHIKFKRMKKLLFLLTFVAFSFGLSAQTIFSENFNSSTNIPTGWTVYADNLTNYYSVDSKSWFISEDAFGTGDNAAMSISYTTPEGNACDRWLVTPAININQSGLFLRFKLWGYSDQFPEQIKVYVSTTNNQKASFTTVLQNISPVPAGVSMNLIDLSAYQGQTIYIGFQNYGDGYYVALDNIEVLVPEQYGIELTDASMPTYVAKNTDATISATVRNLGTQNLTSFDAYFIDGTDTSAVQTISGINLSYYDEYEFDFTEAFNVATEGQHNIQVVVTNVNDTEGTTYEDQTSITTTVYDDTQAVPRTVLLEQFTTTNCGNCPRAITDISQAVSGRDDVIWVAQHSGYYTDAMTCNESEDLLVFFGSDGSYAPAWMLDRTHMDATQAGPAMYPYHGEITSQIDIAAAVPTFVSVSIDNFNYNPSTNEITVNVSGEFTADMTFDSPRLSIYLIEDALKYSQSGYSGIMTHNNVMRKSLIGNTWGEAITSGTTAGSTFSKEVTCTLPTNVTEGTNCRVVAFVSNYASNINNRKVYNADVTHNITGIHEEEDNLIEMMVYPNPVMDVLNITTEMAIDRIEVYNMQGQIVKYINGNIRTINVSDLSAGTYMFNIVTDNGLCVKKIVKE